MGRSKKCLTQRGVHQAAAPEEPPPETRDMSKKARAMRRVRDLVPDLPESQIPFRASSIDEGFSRKRQSTALVSYSAQLLPLSFGTLSYGLVDCVLEPTADGQFGLKVKNIDQRCVVRRFYPDPPSSPAAHHLRINDVVVAVGNCDARAHRFDDVVRRITRAGRSRQRIALRVARPLVDDDFRLLPEGTPVPPAHIHTHAPTPKRLKLDDDREPAASLQLHSSADYLDDLHDLDDAARGPPARVPRIARPSLRRISRLAPRTLEGS